MRKENEYEISYVIRSSSDGVIRDSGTEGIIAYTWKDAVRIFNLYMPKNTEVTKVTRVMYDIDRKETL